MARDRIIGLRHILKRCPLTVTCNGRTSRKRMPSARCSVTTLLLAPSSMLSSAGLFCFSSFRLRCAVRRTASAQRVCKHAQRQGWFHAAACGRDSSHEARPSTRVYSPTLRVRCLSVLSASDALPYIARRCGITVQQAIIVAQQGLAIQHANANAQHVASPGIRLIASC